MFGGEQVGLVDEQQALTLALPGTCLSLRTFNVLDVALKIFGAEMERVASVDDLNDEVRAFDNAPQLAPDLDVTFERRENEILLFLNSTIVKC